METAGESDVTETVARCRFCAVSNACSGDGIGASSRRRGVEAVTGHSAARGGPRHTWIRSSGDRSGKLLSASNLNGSIGGINSYRN